MAAAPILICYDGSEGAKHAIEAAAGLLSGHPAVVLAVGPPLTPEESYAALGPMTPSFQELNEDEALDRAKEGAELAKSVGFAAEEVPPKEGERADVLHAAASTGASASLRRSARTSRNENAPRNAITPSSESSSPGQVTPAPSAPQKQPKLVSSRPTAYLIVFSGTRSSGPRARPPAPTTTTTAA